MNGFIEKALTIIKTLIIISLSLAAAVSLFGNHSIEEHFPRSNVSKPAPRINVSLLGSASVPAKTCEELRLLTEKVFNAPNMKDKERLLKMLEYIEKKRPDLVWSIFVYQEYLMHGKELVTFLVNTTKKVTLIGHIHVPPQKLY